MGQDRQKRKSSIFLRLVFAFGALLLILVVAYFAAAQWAQMRYDGALEQFGERFGKTSYEEFIPAPVPDEQDAGRRYREAAALLTEKDAGRGEWSVYDAVVDSPEAFAARDYRDAPLPGSARDVARERLAAADDVYAVLTEARSLEAGSAIGDYDVAELMKPLARLRALQRFIAAKAVLEAQAGNLENACQWLESAVHLPDTMKNDPTLLVQMVRIALLELALDATQVVFNGTEEALPLSDRFWKILSSSSDKGVFLNGLASEIAYSASMELPGPTVWISLNQAKMVELVLELDNIMQSSPHENRSDRLTSFGDQVESLSSVYMVAKMAIPNLGRSALTQCRLETRCALLQTAVALRAHKLEKGAYPETLAALELPESSRPAIDAYTGAPFSYQPHGEGFYLTVTGEAANGGRDGQALAWEAVQ